MYRFGLSNFFLKLDISISGHFSYLNEKLHRNNKTHRIYKTLLNSVFIIVFTLNLPLYIIHILGKTNLVKKNTKKYKCNRNL